MKYFPNEIEANWQKYWSENQTFAASNNSEKPKYYVLDMFPYPSGAGLHVGHPLGYIASDIVARYKRHKGFNVLHPQGYDSFGLPAEQYAIQTGQHPDKTTKENIARYREQLDRIGFSFDWSREVRTSSPDYYKWTQWIFIQLFESYFCRVADKAYPITELIKIFKTEGNANVDLVCDDGVELFSAEEWNAFSWDKQQKILLQYRLTYLAETEVNWCPGLGTVLANDEIVNGVSERGGHPVIRKKMTQWSMRISAYAERLLQGLNEIDWTESLKESQRNWIGKSIGAMVSFKVLPPTPFKGGGVEPGYMTGDSLLAKDLLVQAKEMRKEPTLAESMLWEELRRENLGFRFRRQHLVGKYIADFVCLEKKLIVEVDGEYHNDPEQKILDEERTLELEQKHLFKVIRFTNDEVKHNKITVLNKIKVILDTRASHRFVSPSFGGGRGEEISVFTTRPDTIFGVTFMTLAPEHDLVAKITTSEQKQAVEAYVYATAKRSERERMADVKTISGVFTGAYAEHPFTKEPIPVWIGDYVLAGYGTGAVMAVPCGDERDYAFANFFKGTNGMPEIKNIFALNSPPLEGCPKDGVVTPLEGCPKGGVVTPLEGCPKDGVVTPLEGCPTGGVITPQDGCELAEAYSEKTGFTLKNSDFLNGLGYKEGTKKAIEALEKIKQGKGKTNYRLRDAVFSRQRYWGEPFPVYYVNGLPQMIDKKHLPIVLPEVEKYLPTEDGQPPLGNASTWAWDIVQCSVVSNQLIDKVKVFPLELNTMPGWAGSSWYWMRYMDAHNEDEFASKEALDYWQNVDLYIGGSEHATGHLLYARFWNKFLKDRGFAPTEEPFKKLINQGMILGESAFINRLDLPKAYNVGYKNGYLQNNDADMFKDLFVSSGVCKKIINGDQSTLNKYISTFIENKYSVKDYKEIIDSLDLIKVELNQLHVDVSFVGINNAIDTYKFSEWRKEIKEPKFIYEEDGKFLVSREVEKMSKSKYNVVNPDEICNEYGADTLRLYEMFLGPLEQAKPWNTAGITGVFGFLKKLWRLYFDDNGSIVTNDEPTAEMYKSLHKTIKKVTEDIENFSFNTSVSQFMICVNELQQLKCHHRAILEPLAVVISPYAPHIAEELWSQLGHEGSISTVDFPIFDPNYLVESEKEYPVSFNGKMRFTIKLSLDLTPAQIEELIMKDERTITQLAGNTPKKIIIVPGKVINLVG